MKLIFKSMVSLFALANLAVAASKDERELPQAFGTLTVRSQETASNHVAEVLPERISELRRNITDIVMGGGAAKRRAEAVEGILRELPEGLRHTSLDQGTIKVFVAQQNVDGLWVALAIRPVTQTPALALQHEEVSQPQHALRLPVGNVLPQDEGEEEAVAVPQAAPVLALVWFDPAQQNAGVEDQRLALVSAQKLMLENAELLGRRQAVQAAMETADTQLKAAQIYYEDLIAAVMGMKEDLREIQIPRLKAFSASHEEATPEVYVDLLVAYLRGDGRQIEFIQVPGQENPRGQIQALQDLLAQAKESLRVARGELERINHDMLQLQ